MKGHTDTHPGKHTEWGQNVGGLHSRVGTLFPYWKGIRTILSVGNRLAEGTDYVGGRQS